MKLRKQQKNLVEGVLVLVAQRIDQREQRMPHIDELDLIDVVDRSIPKVVSRGHVHKSEVHEDGQRPRQLQEQDENTEQQTSLEVKVRVWVVKQDESYDDVRETLVKNHGEPKLVMQKLDQTITLLVLELKPQVKLEHQQLKPTVVLRLTGTLVQNLLTEQQKMQDGRENAREEQGEISMLRNQIVDHND